MSSQEDQLENFSRILVDEKFAPQYVVRLEEDRTEGLLDEAWADPYAHDPRFVQLGRQALAKTGLYTPKQPYPIERPHLEQDQEQRQEWIREELSHSREQIRKSALNGVDDTAVDAYIGLRSEDNLLLPSMFRELHHRAEDQMGEKLTFLKWMADVATDEQLMNVWQWHHDYLNSRNKDPAFQERVESIKAEYLSGLDAAITAGVLHPSMAEQRDIVGKIRFTHSSPLSPVTAHTLALADRRAPTVYLRDDATDFVLFHELTHKMGTLYATVDEETVDLAASAIYSHSAFGKSDPESTEAHIYDNQIATLRSIERMTNGTISLYTLSECFSGTDMTANTIKFIMAADNAIGLPITMSLIKSADSYAAMAANQLDIAKIARDTSLIVRQQAEFLENMLMQAGDDRPKTLQGLLELMLRPETLARFDELTIASGLAMVGNAMKYADEMSAGR